MKVVQEKFLQKVRSLWRKQIFVHIDEEFAINGIQTKFLSLLLTGKFRRGVTERVRVKKNHKGCIYRYSASVHSIILLFANP